jgi:integrase/recombinase XerD
MEYLVEERNLSLNTQSSYRDTLALMLPFIAEKVRKSIDKLLIEHISPEVIRLFLLYIEQHRSCSISTRNQRLAAIHALAGFIGERCPEHGTHHLVWTDQSYPFQEDCKGCDVLSRQTRNGCPA